MKRQEKFKPIQMGVASDCRVYTCSNIICMRVCKYLLKIIFFLPFWSLVMFAITLRNGKYNHINTKQFTA